MNALKNYGLSITLGLLFLSAWIGQFFIGWVEFTHEQTDHNTPALLGDYLWSFGRATLENWQSEWLQLLTFVILTAFLVHKDSHESRDGQDRLEAKVDQLLEQTKPKSRARKG